MGASGPAGLAYTIWNGIWRNASAIDAAVDLHTVSTGADSPLWVYADFEAPYVERLAKLTEADIIKIDPGKQRRRVSRKPSMKLKLRR